MYSELILNLVLVSLVKGHISLPVPNEALDKNLLEEALDPELCLEQLEIIRNNTLLTMFCRYIWDIYVIFLHTVADAGMRVPRGIFEGNTLDMGNYHQCIRFNQPIAPNNEIQGKYCMIQVPVNQNFDIPLDLPETSNFNPKLLRLDSETLKTLEEFNALRTGMQVMTGVVDNRTIIADNPALAALTFRLALCIPKPCTTEQAIHAFLFNASSTGFKYTDEFCRLPGDKPWVPGDTVAVVVFSLIGLLTVVSTTFDIYQKIILNKDPKTVSVIGTSFSVYTNGRRVMNFQSGPNSIDCLDGIRAITMMWVVLGHTFTSVQNFSNPLDGLTWMSSWKSLWVSAGTISVDTFFTLSGFLVVYTTVGKLNSNQLIKSIHLFWLNRLLRLFPLLAIAALLEATYLNRLTDGPMWSVVGNQVENCRTYWWSTLLHIHNFTNASCVGPTWYLAIDVQLHILSPILLFWVLMGNKRIAWAALLTGLIGIITASTIYNFLWEFPSTIILAPMDERLFNYLDNYYMNTLTRASPFFVGMLFGYIVKTQKLVMSKIITACFWIAVFSLSTFLMYTNYPIIQPDWDNQVADSLYNSFMRPLWALFVGCVVFACVNGYGGPINWFLSLKAWKLQARMSYGIYLFHFGLMAAFNGSAIAPVFFSVKSLVFQFLAFYTLSFIVSFVMTLLIDAPCSTLIKLALGGTKKPVKKEEEEEPKKDVEKTV